MNHELAREVWQRLSQFEIDDDSASYPFSARLAKENGWSRGYARRVIEEYKRYLLLCVAGNEPPCPSEQVDQAWHLHLTYTRSYWKQLCGEILGRPIHHEPTRGGEDEHHKHVGMYDRTLASYREFFGHEPPLDIWPPARIRFGDDVEHQRVNVRRHWIIPKSILWPLASRRWLPTAVCAGFVVLPLATLNPLEWAGPTFLILFAAMYAMVLVAGLVLRSVLRGSPPETDGKELTPAEAACLAYNQPAAINATICQMVQQGSLRLGSDERKFLGITFGPAPFLTAGESLPLDAGRMEQEIFKAAQGKSKASYHELHQAGLSAAGEIERGLVERGLIEPPENTALARWFPFALMMSLVLVGLVKIGVGVWRDRPVTFLVIGCVIAFVTALFFLRQIRRSRTGDKVLELLRARHANLAGRGVGVTGVSDALSPTTVAMAAGLFGAGVLAGGPLEGLQSLWMSHQRTYYGNGGCGGGCSGAGCGGGGGGGCGGGGCGGGCGGCGGG
ncbi:MAG TPA: TIGR04222 domain-containing membrane protein [Pirellulaceae bacterium]|nr:TIGR04222 domain-containing membrane protein [Pirellulaceae bacterium]